MDIIVNHNSEIFVFGFTVFILACIIGYYVVWSVTPSLHSPLMSVTNAISSVIIVGAILAAGSIDLSIAKIFGLIAVVLASVNIFGGFIVTYRMLSMFKSKTPRKKEDKLSLKFISFTYINFCIITTFYGFISYIITSYYALLYLTRF